MTLRVSFGASRGAKMPLPFSRDALEAERHRGQGENSIGLVKAGLPRIANSARERRCYRETKDSPLENQLRVENMTKVS